MRMKMKDMRKSLLTVLALVATILGVGLFIKSSYFSPTQENNVLITTIEGQVKIIREHPFFIDVIDTGENWYLFLGEKHDEIAELNGKRIRATGYVWDIKIIIPEAGQFREVFLKAIDVRSYEPE